MLTYILVSFLFSFKKKVRG